MSGHLQERRLGRVRFWLLLGVTIAGLVIAQAGCQRDEQGPLQVAPRTATPDQEGWNSTITLTKMGRVTAVVDYGHMAKYNDAHKVELDDGVIVNFFDEKGRNTSRLTSRRGFLNEVNDDVEAQDHVVVESDSGITLYTHQIAWDARDQMIRSDTLVTIITQVGDTLHGEGFESDQTLSDWRILKPRGVTVQEFDWRRIVEEKPAVPDSTQATAPEVDTSAVKE